MLSLFLKQKTLEVRTIYCEKMLTFTFQRLILLVAIIFWLICFSSYEIQVTIQAYGTLVSLEWFWDTFNDIFQIGVSAADSCLRRRWLPMVTCPSSCWWVWWKRHGWGLVIGMKDMVLWASIMPVSRYNRQNIPGLIMYVLALRDITYIYLTIGTVKQGLTLSDEKWLFVARTSICGSSWYPVLIFSLCE